MNDRTAASTTTPSVERRALRSLIPLGEAEASYAYAEPPPGSETGEAAFTAIGQAVERIGELAAEGAMTQVLVPIDAAILLDAQAAARFGEICEALPQDVRDRLLFEVTGLTESFSQAEADDIAIILYPHCHAYIARVASAAADFKLLTTCNFAGVAIDLGGRPWPEDEARPALAAFVEKSVANRLTSFLHGVDAPELVDLARETGVNYADGAALGGLD